MNPAAFVRVLRRGLDWAAAGLLAVILVVAATRVAARYLFGAGLPWSEELTRLLFVWLVLIAASRTRHMSIDFLPAAAPPRVARALRLFATMLGVGLLGFLAWRALDLIEITAYDRFTALGVSVQYLYWSVVVGCSFWILLSLAALVWPEPESEPGE
ncbi:TRAP transporter small permease [Pikeienuella sp. HZG-20]|uniref:TRAP transporter small permease n=1 Tax=Paludibacillus litoralis TaxID=3133267 RepID=UPI0030ED4B56